MLQIPKLNEEEFHIVKDERKRAAGKTVVSVNPNLGRLVLYQATLAMMKEKTGKEELTNVVIKTHPEYPDYFWIQPCSEDAKGHRKVHSIGTTRILSAKKLTGMGRLKDMEKTEQFHAEWDENNNALVVDLSNPAT